MTGPYVGALAPTEKQLEVVDRIGHGEDISQIAHEMHISPYTVRGHLRTALERLDARNGANAYAIAISRGLLKPIPVGGTDAA